MSAIRKKYDWPSLCRRTCKAELLNEKSAYDQSYDFPIKIGHCTK